jgi:riboflavin synthase
MFTGLIEAVCTVKSVRQNQYGAQLTVELGSMAQETEIGDSIAITGACLTVSSLNNSSATFELSGETLQKTTLGKLKPSSEVNIERALKANGRFGGHIVQGHIDGKGIIKAKEKQGQFWNVKFSAPRELIDQMVPKGSIAVDGISLTIAKLDNKTFTVSIIPQTLKRTTLGKAKVGDEVNIEIDIIAKIIRKQLENIFPRIDRLTIESLKKSGF